MKLKNQILVCGMALLSTLSLAGPAASAKIRQSRDPEAQGVPVGKHYGTNKRYTKYFYNKKGQVIYTKTFRVKQREYNGIHITPQKKVYYYFRYTPDGKQYAFRVPSGLRTYLKDNPGGYGHESAATKRQFNELPGQEKQIILRDQRHYRAKRFKEHVREDLGQARNNYKDVTTKYTIYSGEIHRTLRKAHAYGTYHTSHQTMKLSGRHLYFYSTISGHKVNEDFYIEHAKRYGRHEVILQVQSNPNKTSAFMYLNTNGYKGKSKAAYGDNHFHLIDFYKDGSKALTSFYDTIYHKD